jgi:hypothetical protein
MHLLALWNPSYADDPLEAHLAVLLDRVRRWRAHTIADSFARCARSGRVSPVPQPAGRACPERRWGLPHLDALRELAAGMDPDDPQERHLELAAQAAARLMSLKRPAMTHQPRVSTRGLSRHEAPPAGGVSRRVGPSLHDVFGYRIAAMPAADPSTSLRGTTAGWD